MPKVCVAFQYEQQEWTHQFDVDALTTVLDLKRKMTSSAPEHASWFEICKDGMAKSNLDTIIPEETYTFRFLGPDAVQEDELALPPNAAPLTSAAQEDDDYRDLLPAAPAPSSAPVAPDPVVSSVPRWKIVGGADKGGIIVRQSESLKSPEIGRVSTGAIVEEVARVGDRLCYRLEDGKGPSKGWVSLKVSGKELAVKV
eukprot:TRINITY_DN29246_c0_g1_i1.p1 TRINITY_DN29246_c0_g1~~TRINITY_DN29246_c0_g1_i1.p1  ORF type:complete len:212 (+),score=46.63 TRINITY_DN29246_c0_g1_i1:40-636(+)